MKIENICESPVRRKPRSLIVVVTEGCQPVQCYSIGDTELNTISVPVPPLDKQYIKVSIEIKTLFLDSYAINACLNCGFIILAMINIYHFEYFRTQLALATVSSQDSYLFI